MSLCVWGAVVLILGPEMTWLRPRGVQFDLKGHRIVAVNAINGTVPIDARAAGFTCFSYALLFIVLSVVALRWRSLFPWMVGIALASLVPTVVLTFLAAFSASLPSTWFNPQYT